MTRGLRWYLFGCLGLVTLAGCGKGFMQFAEREPWRHDAEVACLNSGTVREGAGVVRIEPISGPGMCGADFPFKVSALGESPAYGYSDELVRPPGAIPGVARPAAQPRWPIQQSPYDAPQQQPYSPSAAGGEPMSIEAPGTETPQTYQGQQLGAPPSNLRAPPEWQRRPGGIPMRAAPAPAEVDDEDDEQPAVQAGPPPRAPARSVRCRSRRCCLSRCPRLGPSAIRR